MKKRPVVAAYYFPNWHCDPKIEDLHGKGWTEWQVVKYATPRFPGHQQPKVPLWGYQDESSPTVMAQKISAAKSYGIDAFIFDWYSFNNGTYRERCLNDGFLKASNCQKIKFALMWCNHNPCYVHPGNYWKPAETNWRGDDITPETFRRETDIYIRKYFSRPNYLRVDNGIYFSIFQPRKMIDSLGGPDAAKKLFAEFKDKVRAAGLGELNLNAKCDGSIKTAAELKDYEAMLKQIGFDSISEYGWAPLQEFFPACEAEDWAIAARENRIQKCSAFDGLYYPSVTARGWDSSPRTVQSDMYEYRGYPFLSIVVNYTPERFEEELEAWNADYQNSIIKGNMLLIACWNEWTEGMYLEPDAEYGYGFLQAVKNVFGKSE